MIFIFSFDFFGENSAHAKDGVYCYYSTGRLVSSLDLKRFNMSGVFLPTSK